jgi:hypothetical protein
MTISEVLAPLSLSQFKLEVSKKNPLRIVGSSQRFATLFSWSTLNTVLAHHALDASQISVAVAGKRIAEEEYLNSQSPYSFRTKITPGLAKQMKAGALLTLGGIDEIVPDITALSCQLERAFSAQVTATLEACISPPPGETAGPEWNLHDTIILQVVGATRFLYHGESQTQPIEWYSPFMREPPVGGASQEVNLETGSVLFIPRGGWYQLLPSSAPCLWLIFAIFNATSWNLASWLIGRMKDYKLMRIDVPYEGDETARVEYLATMKRMFVEELDRKDLIGEFMQNWNGMADSRPHFDFPYSEPPNCWSDGVDGVICAIPSRTISYREPGAEPVIQVMADGHVHTFHPAAKNIVQCILNGGPITLRELVAKFQDDFTEEQVRGLVKDLSDASLLGVNWDIQNAVV